MPLADLGGRTSDVSQGNNMLCPRGIPLFSARSAVRSWMPGAGLNPRAKGAKPLRGYPSPFSPMLPRRADMQAHLTPAFGLPEWGLRLACPRGAEPPR